MQNSSLRPPNTLEHHQQYSHVGQEQGHGQPSKPAGFQSADEVEAFVNQAAAENRHYDLEPLPGEAGPWTSDQPGTSITFGPWDAPTQLPLVNPYTMQSQPQGPYAAHNQPYDNYYPPSSTESTPPNGFVPYYIDTQHPPISQLHHPGPISPYSAVLSPSSDPNSLSDPEAEQKRLRNTAASARFRAKKKKREASLERASNERRALVNKLEGRVKELEEENKWLKNLVWEKRDVREEKELKRRRGDDSSVDGEGQGKHEGDRNDGVGTI